MLLRDFDNLVCESNAVSVDNFSAVANLVGYVIHDGNGYERVGNRPGKASPSVRELHGVAGD